MTQQYDGNAALGQKFFDQLKKSEYWTSKTRHTGATIQGLKCPSCGDPGAWAYTEGPMSINCNRQNQCGARTRTLELFPELRTNIERDFPATKADRDRPAREYLLSRGITTTTLNGLKYWYLKDARKTGSGAVMFPIGKDEKGKDIANGRLFNPPAGQGKTHNIGSTAGRYWRHPGHKYDPARPVWITEGILDALSLLSLGRQAIAALAAGQDPGNLDLTEFPDLVLSFDNDEAGRRAVKKWRLTHPTAEAILCDPGQDWNDLLNSGPLDQAKKIFEKALPRYRTNGKLALAENAQEWADIYRDFYSRPPGLFEFQQQTFFAVLKTRRSGEETYLEVSRCLRGTIEVLSYVQDRSNPARPTILYILKVQPKGTPQRTITATGKDLATTRALNEFLLTTAKIPWEGDPKAATALQVRITGDKRAPEVQLLPVIGYQPEVGAYVYHKWAVDQAGRIITPDKRGHFRLSFNRIYQAPIHAEGKSITPATINHAQVKDIYRLIRDAWGENGAFALAWTIAGWFVNQIKEEINLFPFLSMYGDPASGKSALVTLLNAIQGREGEGLPITQLNSKKGSVRTIGQVSGLFTALLEDNDRNDRGFDYSILLTAYNRGPLQVQAVFSNDLQTRENPFLGTLLFAQNTEPFDSKAERQRVISLQFKAEAITDNSRAAYEKLTAMDKRDLAGIMRQVLVSRPHLEKSWRQEYSAAQADLAPLSEQRILNNHALILAFHRLFCSCFDIKEAPETVKYFADIARQKCVSSAIRQTNLADHFFELLDTLNTEQAQSCYHINPKSGLIYVNLPRVEYILRDIKKMSFQVNEHLSTALQKHPSFCRNGLTYRFPHDPDIDGEGRPKKRKVWAFWLEWHKNNKLEDEDLPKQ